MTFVIISGGIDLSVGSIYALSGVASALVLRMSGQTAPLLGFLLCVGTGTLAGLMNGALIARLGVHPFIITLGTMWVYRGIAFVTTKAQSILVPEALTEFTKSNLGLRKDLFPVPMLVMLSMTAVGAIILAKTVWGRRVFAIGGNVEASRYAGVPIGRVLTGVYVFSGFTAGLAAFLGSGFYGSASSGDAQGYELFVIASAVVGGASLQGGRGAATGALLGALMIVMIRQSIRTLGLDQNYEWIIIGVAIILAVVLDRLNRSLADRRLLR
jgi:ribose transport system permease protein